MNHNQYILFLTLEGKKFKIEIHIGEINMRNTMYRADIYAKEYRDVLTYSNTMTSNNGIELINIAIEFTVGKFGLQAFKIEYHESL